MARYKLRLSYNGTQYSGWQIQNNARSIQGEIQKVMHTLFSKDIGIVGCGRTDAGVHARGYVAHFDLDDLSAELDLKYKLNRILDDDIVIHDIDLIHDSFHARFDAISRSYSYQIQAQKDPFNLDGFYFCTYLDKLALDSLNEAATILLRYPSFFPFCKTHSDAQTMDCNLTESHWVRQGDTLTYNVTSNRFLRGMVRLIVGMCINVALGKISTQEVIDALENQTRLNQSWSVPACGLYLTDIVYPE